MTQLFLGLLLLVTMPLYASENGVFPVLHIENWNSMDKAYPELENKCAQLGGVLISKFAEESARESTYSSLGVAGVCKLGKKSKEIYIPVTYVTGYAESQFSPLHIKKKCSDLGGELVGETIRELMGNKLSDPYISTAVCKL